MKVFVVSVNGQKVCSMGLDVDGVISAIINRVGSPDEEEIFLELGGLDNSTREYLRWQAPPIQVGDSVTIQIVEAASADIPADRISADEVERMEAEMEDEEE